MAARDGAAPVERRPVGSVPRHCRLCEASLPARCAYDCGHAVCMDCYDAWQAARAGKPRACPVCRAHVDARRRDGADAAPAGGGASMPALKMTSAARKSLVM